MFPWVPPHPSCVSDLDRCVIWGFRSRGHDGDGDSERCLRIPSSARVLAIDRLDDAHAALGQEGLDSLHSIALKDWQGFLDKLGSACGFLGT